MFARPTLNIQKCIVVVKLMEINFSMFLNFFDVISEFFFDLFSMFFFYSQEKISEKLTSTGIL